jgi:ribosomal protein S18 acetylase RimI-like enzyme
VGRQLFDESLQIARRERYRGVRLWVLEANTHARSFYERAGLRLGGARRTDPSFLGNDSAEVRYVLPLR